MDVESLSPAQRDALAQLQALTNGGDAEVAIGVLASVDWDVQVSTIVFAMLNVLAPGAVTAQTMVMVSRTCALCSNTFPHLALTSPQW